MVELRWVVPEDATTEHPRLQYRQQQGQWPATWSKWMDVPIVVVADDTWRCLKHGECFGGKCIHGEAA